MNSQCTELPSILGRLLWYLAVFDVQLYFSYGERQISKELLEFHTEVDTVKQSAKA